MALEDNNNIEDNGIVLGNTNEEALDPNNTFFDEKGRVISIHDPETGETFTNDAEEGSEKPLISPESLATGEIVYNNPAEFLLKQMGYEGDTIEFEEGKSINLSELSPSDQIKLVSESVNNIIEEYESKIKTLTEESSELKTDDEKKIISYLRNGGNLREFAKEILENDPLSKISGLSSEDLVRDKVKEDNPSWTEDEIEEEMEDLKSRNKIERQAKSIRAKYEADNQVSLDALKSKTPVTNENTFNAAEYETQVKNIVSYATGIKEISGYELNNETKNHIIDHIASLDEKTGDTKFLQELATPKDLFDAAFWKLYGPKLVEAAYNKGKAEITSKLDDNPEVAVRGNNTYDGNFDIDKLLKIDTIG